jgi:type IV pilus assembly protein PilW
MDSGSPSQRRRRQRGFTVVELMIALVLGLLLIAGAIALFVQTKRNFVQDEQITRMQENARVAMSMLTRDLQMADFWGGMQSSAAIQLDDDLSITADCGTNWAYDTAQPLEYLSAATAATAAARFTCLDASSLHVVGPGANVLAVKRVQGTPVEDTDTEDGTVYLSTNGTAGLLYGAPLMAMADEGARQWAYIAHVYFIANSNGTPMLTRMRLRPGAPTMEREPGDLAEGIEHFVVQFGIDNDGDGIANQYVSNPGPAIGNSAVSARVFVLVRSRDPIAGYTNAKEYQMGAQTLPAFNDGFYRRVYTTTVALRNPANMRRLGN